MLVKDATLGLTWITPVSNDDMNTALDSAQRLANQAGSYATQAGTSATNADLSARQAERINQVTMDQINEKFWWGTLEEYNALEYINEGTFYYIQV